MADKPTLYVCHGDEGGARMHPCRRVQEAMHAKGIDYDKVIAAHGSPFPFLRTGARLHAGGRPATPLSSKPSRARSAGT